MPNLKVTWILLLLFALSNVKASSDIPNMTAAMQWRLVGPFRAGRTVAVSGVVQHPNTFYMAPNNGGVWKSTDYGLTWQPIFDGQPTGSVGSLAVAPSDPNVLYVGSGEGLQRPDLSVGDGIYKSTDGGQSWEHLGLRDGYQIPSIAIDPANPNRLFVAVLGHPYGPNKERGLFRSADGGRTFQSVLFRDENTGAMQVAFDPHDREIVYAVLWSARQAPWEVGNSFNGPGSGLFKSTDGGTTWHAIGKGLPTPATGLGRIGFAIAPSDSRRMYAQVDSSPDSIGLYRSDDAGDSWVKVNNESRIDGRGSDFACVQVDPLNKDRIYVANTSLYRSEDAGKTFLAIKGAPGGDDYHTVWINPKNPDLILLGVDQGATLTVNGGRTWSSWYNQPTAQFYHVITDYRFPYWIYGGQQESGSIGIASRSDDGSISFRNWHTVGVEEYGYVAPDPLHPNLTYGGKATRFDFDTGDVQDISPEALRGQHRSVRTMPLLFSPADPHVLLLGAEVVFKTIDGGNHWTIISPDLTRKTWDIPDVIKTFESQDPEHGKHRGVIYSIAPSPKDVNWIWAGTDDGLIHLTRNGGAQWTDVTPKELTPWSKVSLLEASHFDTQIAYAAINRFRLDDLKPHIYRTRDAGRTWESITNGLPERAVVNAVREDPQIPGLLYAGTEIGVFISIDDGAHWASLQRNLPVTAVRDLVVHNDDLIVGTHGRSFWVLDDITPLREIASGHFNGDSAHLLAPAKARRWRWNRNTDTPLPPEEPVGQNPPDGAILDYFLPEHADAVSLNILNSQNQVIRHYSSQDKPTVTESELRRELNVPTYWVRPERFLSAAKGAHRFIWDLRYAPPHALNHEYPISAIYRNTPRWPLGTFVLPGTYTVRLTVGTKTFSELITVVIDPRITTPSEGLETQFRSSSLLSGWINEDAVLFAQAKSLQKTATDTAASVPDPALRDSLKQLSTSLAALAGAGGRSRSASTANPSLSVLNNELARVYAIIQGSDNAPTSQALAAVESLRAEMDRQRTAWQQLQSGQLQTVNEQLRKAKLPTISVPTPSIAALKGLGTDNYDADADEP